MKARFRVWILMFVSIGIFLIAFMGFIKRHYDSWQAMGGISFYDEIIIYDFWATYAQIGLYAIGTVGVLIRNRIGWMMITFGLYSYWGHALGFSFWYSKNVMEYIFSTLIGLIIFAILFLLSSNRDVKLFYNSKDVIAFSTPIIAGIISGLFVEIGKFYI